jgi:hypothetical protein
VYRRANSAAEPDAARCDADAPANFQALVFCRLKAAQVSGKTLGGDRFRWFVYDLTLA